MITVNIQANNKNYYRGHEPSNEFSNCWTDKEDEAITFTLEQAREILNETWLNDCNIVISKKSEAIIEEVFKKEMFCLDGGRWYDYYPVKI